MKRPPGLWILLSAGFLWLNLEGVYGVRATSLIFGRSTTTTTTSTTTTESSESADEEGITTDPPDGNPTLTGNPQIDYVWDPNLPKELNGYNLSTYPFYERVPEDIDFKCDGLHDGFYASVKHKCQVYHHCLFGVRYDFLCANYTAFDQTLFNCNFVSNVDCTNSKKYWHRNDALYIEKSTTTTTSAPIVYSFYTPPTAGYALQAIPRVRGKLGQHREAQIAPQIAVQVSPQLVEQVPTQVESQQGDQPAVQAPQQVVGQLAPQQIPVILSDYPVEPRRRARPSSRRRPVYDYYEDYEEPAPRRSRPRRPRPLYYDYEDYEDDRYERRGGRRRRPYDRMRPSRRDKDRRRKYEYYDDDDVEEEYDDDYIVEKSPKTNRRRKYEDDYEENTRRDRPSTRRTEPKIEEKPWKRRKSTEGPKNPPRLGVRRPPSQDYEDELQSADKTESYDRRRKNSNDSSYKKPLDDTATIIKPVSGTLYDRPRPAPKINLPVPKNAAEKYAYKPITPRPEVSEEVGEEPLPKEPKKSSSNVEQMHEEYSEVSTRAFKRTKLDSNSAEAPRLNILKRPVKPEESTVTESSGHAKATAPSSGESFEKSDPIIRKFKRPVSSNRNFSGRNLKTSNEEDNKNDGTKTETGPKGKTGEGERQEQDTSDTMRNVEENDSKSGPMRVKVPIRVNKFLKEKTTEEPKLEELYEKYDVTLNEAAPAQTFPSGFDIAKDYTYSRYFKSSKL